MKTTPALSRNNSVEPRIDTKLLRRYADEKSEAAAKALKQLTESSEMTERDGRRERSSCAVGCGRRGNAIPLPGTTGEPGRGRRVHLSEAKLSLRARRAIVGSPGEFGLAPLHSDAPHPLQVAAWQKMGGTGRSELAAGLRRQVRQWKREALRAQNPGWAEERVDRELAAIYLRGNT